MTDMRIDFDAMTLHQGRRIIANLSDRHRYGIAEARAIAEEYRRLGRRLSTQDVLPILYRLAAAQAA